MSKLKLVLYPAPSLQQPSQKVVDFASAKKLIPDMIETMIDHKGFGLAAPQVGQNIRLAIINKDVDKSLKDHLVIINPKIFSASGKMSAKGGPDQPLAGASGWDEDEEGCLSIPEVKLKIKRHRKIKVRYTDASGQEQRLKATGLFARVIQHELDHLDGVLIIERATKMIKGL